MSRSKSIDHYSTAFFRIAEAVGQNMETKLVECRTQAEARSLAGRFYAFVGSLKAAVAKYPQDPASQNELQRYRAQLLPFAHKVEVTLDPERQNWLIFRHRNDSWYSQALERALAEGGPVGGPPPATPADQLPRMDKAELKAPGPGPAGFDEAASLAKLMAKAQPRLDYRDLVKQTSEPASPADPAAPSEVANPTPVIKE